MNKVVKGVLYTGVLLTAVVGSDWYIASEAFDMGKREMMHRITDVCVAGGYVIDDRGPDHVVVDCSPIGTLNEQQYQDILAGKVLQQNNTEQKEHKSFLDET